MPPTFDDLLGRTATDAELQASAADKVGGPGRFQHVVRVLIAHVDDTSTDLDLGGTRANGRQQWEGRRQLVREMVHAEECAIRADLLGCYSEIDGLVEHVAGRAGRRMGRVGPMTEGEEADAFHEDLLSVM
jgi:hypothetical protein